MRVIAFVGPSGKGKSYRSVMVSQQYGADAIIDDGLLISHGKVIAGTSAKKEPTKIASVKHALFMNPSQVNEIKKVLKINKICLLYTSEKAENILNSFDGISNVTCVSSENDSYDFEFDNAMAAEEKKKMFFAFAENEIPILMQKEIEPSLEDIFLKLTDNTSEKEENTNESDI